MDHSSGAAEANGEATQADDVEAAQPPAERPTDRPSNAMLALKISVALGVLGLCAGGMPSGIKNSRSLGHAILARLLVVVLFIAALFSCLHIIVGLVLIAGFTQTDDVECGSASKTAIFHLSFNVFVFALLLALIMQVIFQLWP